MKILSASVAFSLGVIQTMDTEEFPLSEFAIAHSPYASIRDLISAMV